MGKSFHGPYRLARIVDVNTSPDGDFFLRFDDGSKSVIGIVINTHVLKDVKDKIESSLQCYLTENEDIKFNSKAGAL